VGWWWERFVEGDGGILLESVGGGLSGEDTMYGLWIELGKVAGSVRY
jgi:hypothetical protein